MFTSKEVRNFESEFADYIGAKHVIFVNSCTTALLSCLLAIDIRAEMMVAVPDYTYIGSCMPVITIGAIPVIVDIDPLTQSICPKSLREAFSQYDIRAVIHPHLFGRSSLANEISSICKDNGAAYISDCAQLLGDRGQTEMLTEFGPTCFSFGESKILRIGEGGAVATNDDSFAERVRQARHEGETWLRVGASRHGELCITANDVISGLASTSLGLNFRPMAIAGAIGRAMLPEVPARLNRCKENADILSAEMKHMGCFDADRGGRRTWWTYPVLIKEGHFSRDVFLAALLAEGVPVGVHFPRLISSHPIVSSRFRSTAECRKGAKAFSDLHFVLPIYPTLQPYHMKLITKCIAKVISSSALYGGRIEQKAQSYLNRVEVKDLCDGLFLFV